MVYTFHANHRRIFSVDDPASPIEFLNWTGRLSIALPQLTSSAEVAPLTPSTPSHIGLRSALFDLDDRQDARVYRGAALLPGAVIDGPAIIEEATTTLVLPPGTRATLSPAGSFVAEFLPRSL